MVYWAGSEGSTNYGRNQELFHLAGLGNLWTGQGSCYSRGRSTVLLQFAWESDKNHISGAWGCHYVLSLGRMLFLETLGQVYFLCRTSKEIENELNQSIKNTVLLLILFHRFMTVLKNKNHKHWKQAQARISVSPLASRISGYRMKNRNKNCEPSHH